ncbi:hypothetical protein DFQ28_000164 [Apophysomyces sp. BC1034]|nr:hypothetical protein DFQ29_001762 [Apophysomyces sp. BC1021]KAG0191447.1 hypothetical protein DFQ28_000164 [Apophysomyces sp. BC1034]
MTISASSEALMIFVSLSATAVTGARRGTFDVPDLEDTVLRCRHQPKFVVVQRGDAMGMAKEGLETFRLVVVQRPDLEGIIERARDEDRLGDVDGGGAEPMEEAGHAGDGGLHRAGVPLEDTDTGTLGEVPETDGPVVAAGQDLVTSRMAGHDPDVVDGVGMAVEGVAFGDLEVPDAHRPVCRAAQENTRVKVEMGHSRGVAAEGADAFARVVVPDPKRVVGRGRDQLGLVKLKAVDRPLVAVPEDPFVDARKVADQHRAVSQTADQDVLDIAELETPDHTAIFPQPRQNHPPYPSVLSPVAFNHKPLAVHILPRPNALSLLLLCRVWVATYNPTLPTQQREAPAAFGAFSVDVLLTHPVP